MDCPCCSGLVYKECCEPFHSGSEPSTPLQLMRSRYCAYSMGLALYIQKTTHPKSPYFEKDKARWKEGIEEFCRTTKFVKLEIVEVEDNLVSFAAHLLQGGKSFVLQELSQFEKFHSHWRYLSGKVTIQADIAN